MLKREPSAVVLAIGGSDSSAGAGVQADLKTISAHGAYGLSVVTAVTAQDTRGVHSVSHVSAFDIRRQLETVLADFDVRAAKVGLISSREAVDAISEVLRLHSKVDVVHDPVIHSSSGTLLCDVDVQHAIGNQLFPLATLVTPNAPEIETFTGLNVCDIESARTAAARFVTKYRCRAVLAKGGHFQRDVASDILVSAAGSTVYEGSCVLDTSPRGTGCTYASAIACQLAFGLTLEHAVSRAKSYITEAIQNAQQLGSGRPVLVHHPAESIRPIEAVADLPRLHVITDESIQSQRSHLELARLALEGGADAVQFREKRMATTRDLVATATEVHSLCVAHGALAIVNDRVDVALAAGCTAVHVGRDDLDPEDVRRLAGDEFLVGGTANSLEEARSVWRKPVDYLGVGPVFGTRSKANPAPLMGITEFSRICRACPKPVIAIGGISPDRIVEVLRAGAYGIAVISSIVCADSPVVATRDHISEINRFLDEQ